MRKVVMFGGKKNHQGIPLTFLRQLQSGSGFWSVFFKKHDIQSSNRTTQHGGREGEQEQVTMC
jgi:hypothetical protein